MNVTSMARGTALAAACALLVPAGAQAAGTSVVAGPLKAKGYDLTISGSGSSLAIMAAKTSGGSTQMHTWSFTGAKVSAKGIKASLGRYGKIDLRFSGGRSGRGVVPKGCTGTPGKTTVGTMKGSLKLKLDSTFFKTVSAKQLKGQLAKSGKLDCGSGTGKETTGTTLSVTDAGSVDMLMLSISKVGSSVQQMMMRTDDRTASAPASITHMIMAKAPASGLTAAGDLSSATAQAAGPFLTGSLSFTGEPMAGMATGTVSGTFAGKFDSIGTQTLPADATAILMQH